MLVYQRVAINELKLEVPTIYKAYFSGLNFREYPYRIWPYMVQYLHLSYLQNSIAPKWNIYFSFVLKGHLRFTRVSTKPSQIYVRFRANGSSNGKSYKNSARMC